MISEKMTNRIDRLRIMFDEWGVDGVLITGATNRRWLSGFTGSAGTLLITRDKAVLSTDFRYWEQAAREAPSFSLFHHRSEKDDTLNFLRSGGIHRIGFESKALTVSEFSTLQRIEEFEWQPLETTAEILRAEKSPDEIEKIQAAARLTDLTVSHFPVIARPGISERAIAWQLEKFMRDSGADKPAFDIIVASGPNSALPHHHPGERSLEVGDTIIVDLGAEVDGYKSDLTRTFHLGEPVENDPFWLVYNIVAEAQAAAIDGLTPGITGMAGDALARDIIQSAGYGDAFGHGTGHSLGLDIHENLRLSRQSEKVIIPAQAVMTVEPGIYLPGWGGVRIEDLVLVTPNGPVLMSHAPKIPIIPL